MKTQPLEWSDIPFVLAVCEAGSLSAAARNLGVNHSTVFRRIEGVETRLGVRLFERLSQGYVMTPAGELFFQEAQGLRDGLNGIQRELGGQDLRLEGTLSITTTDSLLQYLTPIFAKFQDKYPEIELRLLSEARSFDLMQRDADIAIRPTLNPPEHWSGRQLGTVFCAAYARSDYWDSVKSLPDDQRRWVRLDYDLDQSPMSKLTQRLKAGKVNTTVVNTVIGMLDYVRSGSGVAVLPVYLAEMYPDLVQVSKKDESQKWELWLLSHPDLRRSARVHAFFEFANSSIPKDLSPISRSLLKSKPGLQHFQ